MVMKNRLQVILIFLGFGLVTACVENEEQKVLSPRVNHVMLYVSDLEQTIEFYTSAFDLEVTNRLEVLNIKQSDGSSQSVPVNMAFLKFPGQDFVYEISEQNIVSDSLPPSTFQHVGIDVIDVESALKRAMEAGGELISPIRSVSGKDVSAKIAFIKGPDGEIVELMQLISGEF